MAAEDISVAEPTAEVLFEGLAIEGDDGVALEPGEQAWAPVRTVAARTLAGGAAAQADARWALCPAFGTRAAASTGWSSW